MYIGIDLGTSQLKVVLVNEQGSIVDTEQVSLSVQRSQPHWAEQDPSAWWQATCQIMGRLRQRCQYWHDICAIGLSGQMHGAVVLDQAGQVLRPCILWNDTRSSAECDWLSKYHPEFIQCSANMIMPGFTAPKLLWLARHEPDVFAQISQILLPKDYLRWRLSGEFVSEPSDAAGTLWLDVQKRDWSDRLLTASGLRRAQLPRLVEGNQVSGYLRPDLAAQWGLPDEVVIAGGGGDNAASAVGVGATRPGDAFISLGTSGVIFIVNERLQPAPDFGVHAFCHALPDRWYQMSVMLSAASCLRWCCNLFGVSEHQLMLEIASLTDQQKRQAPLFLPYLSGERTPHNDPLARAGFYQLHHETSRALLGYAVIEGVTFGLADGLHVLQQAGGVINNCSLTGGGAKSTLWAQLLADVTGIPLVTHPDSSSAALGTARLAMLATGGEEADICQKPPIQRCFTPQTDNRDSLQQRLALFRFLYQQQQQTRQYAVATH